MPSMLIPRAHLFGNPNRIAAQISPDGSLLSWLAPKDGVLNVFVGPVNAPQEARPVTDDRKRGIRFYAWTYDGRHLVYGQDEAGDENFHLYAVDVRAADPAGAAARDLTPFEGVTAQVQHISRSVRDRILVGLNRRDPRFHDLHSIELATGNLALVEENPGFAALITDDRYKVHLAVRDTAAGAREILHRPDGAWTPWISFAPDDARSSFPDHLDAKARSLFCRDSRGRDTAALTRIDLATGATTLIAAHDKADIGGLLEDQETHEPLAYSVTTERLHYMALDSRIEADLSFLAGQDIGDWYVMSRTEDDRAWVLGTASDKRPSVDYLYDRASRSLRELHQARPELANTRLAAMRPVTIRSRDGLDLVSYLTQPKDDAAGAPPMVLLVHGGPWARDVFGFHPLHQWLADRGYAVLGVNFRGSTGFGKAFINAADREWAGKMHDDLIDAVDWAIAERVADPTRVAIYGASYGGYSALVGATFTPQKFACAVDLFGISNLVTFANAIPPYWRSWSPVWTARMGDHTTEEGRKFLASRSPLTHVDRIVRPMLIGQGGNDVRVTVAESDQIVAEMQRRNIPVTYVYYSDEGHGFRRPENRHSFTAVVEAFLAQHLGGSCEPVGEDFAGSSIEFRAGRNLIPSLG